MAYTTVETTKSQAGEDIILAEGFYDFSENAGALIGGIGGDPSRALRSAIEAQEKFLEAIKDLAQTDDEEADELVRFSMDELTGCLDSDY
jgi:hypothetical protein